MELTPIFSRLEIFSGAEEPLITFSRKKISCFTAKKVRVRGLQSQG